MKLCQAPALALVGWYLMVRPVESERSLALSQ
jgi:hypothetical protein